MRLGRGVSLGTGGEGGSGLCRHWVLPRGRLLLPPCLGDLLCHAWARTFCTLPCLGETFALCFGELCLLGGVWRSWPRAVPAVCVGPGARGGRRAVA